MAIAHRKRRGGRCSSHARVAFEAKLVVAFLLMLVNVAVANCDGLPPAYEYGIFGSAESYASREGFRLDDEGILVRDYGAAFADLGEFRNPFFITRYANALYRDYLETDCTAEDLVSAFLLHASWLAESHSIHDGMAYWPYPFANDSFGLEAGWISGIGQSHIAGVLFRAFRVTGDRRFASIARAGAEVYRRDVDAGGVLRRAAYGTWIEEYPDPEGVDTDVLNGHITGLLGLIDYATLSGEGELLSLVDPAIDAVRHTIRDFDAGFTSFYSLHGVAGAPPIAAPVRGYNSQHAAQLMALYELDGDPLFLDMAMRFQAYATFVYDREARGATDPDTHGPEAADGSHGMRYWSHNEFPTWYRIGLAEPKNLIGVYVRSRSPESAPKDLVVSVGYQGRWTTMWGTADNSEEALFVEFAAPVLADSVRLDIASDNGNENVALEMVFPVMIDAGYAAVADYFNHRLRSEAERFAVDIALSGGRMTTHRDGFVILPPSSGMVRAGPPDAPGQEVRVSGSVDLQDWSYLGSISVGSPQLAIHTPQFLRLDFDADLGSLRDVHAPLVGRHGPYCDGAPSGTTDAAFEMTASELTTLISTGPISKSAQLVPGILTEYHRLGASGAPRCGAQAD